ncbi:unnamed protein product [Closterium sp. NIES-54]
MDVWGPARVNGQGRERYFLLVVDDYTRYTTVFPLGSKGEVPDVLIPWIRVVRLQLRERFRVDLPVLRLHSDRGGEFSFDLLHDFCRGEGTLQSLTLPDSPQQNGIAERRIGLVMEVARTSMIHAATPHFLWPFAVRYAAHKLNLWPRVSLPETSPTLRWSGKVGDASVFGVWVLVPLFAIRLRTSSPPALFPASSLAFPLTRLAGSFTTPPHAVSSPTALPLPHPCRSSLLQVSLRCGAGDSATRDTGSGGTGVTAAAGGTGGAAAAGLGGALTGGTGAAGTCGVGGAGAGDPTEPGATGARGAGAVGAGTGGTGAGGTRAEGAGAVHPGGTVRPRPYFYWPYSSLTVSTA